MTITQDDARALAVRYNSWHEAVAMEDGPDRARALNVWGDMLIESMEKTGVILNDPENTRRVMDYATRREQARKESE